MKIYFAGSIRGGRDDKETYFKIIQHLKKYGQVLSEHVGDQSLTDFSEDLSDEQIYERDMSWIRDADVVVAEVSTPSLGVGYEIGKAEIIGKELLCLYRNIGKNLSAMISGNSNLKVCQYNSLEEALQHIDDFFECLFKS